MKKRKRSTITKARMLQGIQDILLEEGCNKINVAYVSNYSGIDRKLMYYHFGSFPKMIAEFLQADDLQFKTIRIDAEDPGAMAKYLKQRFNNLFDNPVLKQLLVWELSDHNAAIKKYASKRVHDENQFVKNILAAQNNKGSAVDKQAIFALLLGGVHYLSAYSQQSKKPFLGIDLHDTVQRKQFIDSVVKLLHEIA